MNKRGITHVDWAISIAIFLLFVIFVFIFAQPLYAPKGNLRSIADVIAEEFLEETKIQIQATQIYVASNVTHTNAPIILDYPYTINTSYYYMNGKHLMHDGKRLIFLGDLTPGSTVFEMMEGPFPFGTQDQFTDMSTLPHRTSFTDFLLNVDNGEIQNMYFKTFPVLYNPRYQVDGSKMENYTSSYNATQISAQYGLENPTIQVEQYVFAYTPGVYTYITPKQLSLGGTREYTVTLKIENYTQYYASIIDSNILDYEVERCHELFGGIPVTFFDDQLGALTFAFDNNVTKIEFCTQPSLLNMSISFAPANGTVSYRIIAHEGNHLNGTKYTDAHIPTLGFPQQLEGLHLEGLENFSNTDYTQRKNTWRIPRSRDFEIEIFNDTTKLFSYAPAGTSTQQDIFSSTTFIPLLTHTGNLSYGRLYVGVR